MFGGGDMNPRKMQKMMEQMGIDLDELDAESVVITLADGEELVFGDPDVTRMEARGQETYQIVGEPTTREDDAGGDGEDAAGGDGEDAAGGGEIPEDDVQLVVQRTGVNRADAREALEAEDGDLAAAISRLE